MHSLKSHITTLALLLFSISLLSQSDLKGDYPINNFGKVKTGIGLQNWQLLLIETGEILIANNGGLIKFDGIHWDLFPLPNKTIVRSICKYDEQKIFAGGQDEIGYFDESFNFQSIRNRIPSEHLPLEDVWQILSLDQSIFFRSVNKVFEYDISLDSIKVIDPGNPIISIIKYDGEIYYHDFFEGIKIFRDTTLTVKGSESLKYIQLLDLITFKNRTLAITESHGIFIRKENQFLPLNTELNKYLVKNKLFNSSVVLGDELYLGTQFDGVIAIDTVGNVKANFNKSNGLVNNNVHALLLDRNQDLWVGTSNGIAEIKVNSAIRYIQPDQDESSIFYDVQLYKDRFYFATNNGLFRSNYSEGFEIVEQSAGQTWGLDTIGEELLLGHNAGPFIVDSEGDARLLSNRPGAWKFVPSGSNETIYVGTYTGIDIYKKIKNQFTYHKSLESFQESARIMVSVREKEVWVSHPYRGVFRISHNDDFVTEQVRSYNTKDGLPSELLNYVFNIRGKVYVTGEKGIYYYDRATDVFLPDHELYLSIDSTQNIRRLFEDPAGDIWFITEKEVGFLNEISEGTYEKVTYPMIADRLVGGFEQINFIDSNNVFICTDENIIQLEKNKSSLKKEPIINLHQVRLIENYDSLLTKDQIILNYDQNAMRFSYSSPEHNNGIQYQYNLKGNDKDEWSQWSTASEKDFTNLSPGSYTFQIRSRNLQGLESPINEFTFEIKPPWYLSNVAKSIYGLLFMSMLIAIILVPRTKYKKDKEILIEAKNQSEQELQQVKTEKLNAELASSTLHLVQKNETLTKVKEELLNFRDKVADAKLRKELKRVITVVEDDARLEEDWEKFSTHFDQVHTHFLSRLTKEYPQITPKDRKLCAYLRMNLATKEIAPLMHISVRGVEISRYRLRKKLNLPTDVNLNEFMMKF